LVRDAGAHAQEVEAQAAREAENIRRAAAVYREQVLAGIDHNKDVVAELLDAFGRIREHLGKSEQAALDITAHLHERRTELAEAIIDLRQTPPPEVEAAPYVAPVYNPPAVASYETPVYEAPTYETPATTGYETSYETPTSSLFDSSATDYRSAAENVDNLIDRIVDEVDSEDRF
jgi:hypothetical protein